MMKENSSNQGNQARPSDHANTLAQQLQSIHPADLFQGAHILAEFAGEAMRDASFTAGYGGTFSETEELAATIIVVLRDSPKEFSSLLPDYVRLLGMVRAFCVRQGGNELAIAQLNRITKALAVDADVAVIAADPAPARRAAHWLKGKAVIVAAIALAFLVWDISSDDLLLWQIVAALGLVAVICGAAFRIGQRSRMLQTPVITSPVVAGKVPGGMAGRQS
jgi:hypothetical protein